VLRQSIDEIEAELAQRGAAQQAPRGPVGAKAGKKRGVKI
jgi:hypothetical protein